MDTTMNDTLSTRHLVATPGPHQLHAMRPELVPQARFVAAVVRLGLPFVAQDDFHGSTDPARLAEIGAPILVRSDAKGTEVEALLRLGDNALALIDGNYSRVTVDVASTTGERAAAALARIRRLLAVDEPQPERLTSAFWMRGDGGGSVRYRKIDAPAFDEIAANYAAPVRAALERLVAARAPDRGRLILGRGEPTRRPGRCLLDLEFTPLSAAEANAWLHDHGHDRRVDRPATLAELFGHLDGAGDGADLKAEPARFGFAQALAL
jgi:hypothetical protein